MGARTNFTFTTDTGSLTLYSHWGGNSKNVDLAHALKTALPRLSIGDAAYGLRIIISQLIGPDWNSETGFGLYVGIEGGEEQYEPITIDLTNNTVIDSSGAHSINQYINYHLNLTEPVTV